jgi:hypothetical protein
VVYFGSYAGLDDGISVEVFESLAQKGFIEKDMARESHIAGGLSGMFQQGSNTNDCGAVTCCMASIYVKELMRQIDAFKRWEEEPPETKTCTSAASLTIKFDMQNAILWGKYARHHVGEALKLKQINMMDKALSSICMQYNRGR